METTDWGRAKTVFGRARSLPAANRDAFIRAQLGDDADARRQALGMLALHADVRDRAAKTQLLVAGCDDATLQPTTATTGSANRATLEPKSEDVIENRYTLGDELGCGAFGTVFEAHDRIEDRTVAVKFVALTSPKQTSRYERELATLRRARVPGIVELLDDGRLGTQAFLVMDLVKGQAFPGPGIGPDDIEALLPRAVALFEALQRLHMAGVVHRDLKPDNVLVDDRGQVTIVDLGIAEDETDAERTRKSRRVIGTPLFMAPERAQGATATVQSDLYEATMTVVVALGQDASGTTAQVLRGMDRLAELPHSIEGVFRALVSPRPAERPATAGHVVDVLRTHLRTKNTLRIPRLDEGTNLTQADLRALVRTSNRLFFTRDKLSEVLWRHTRGRPEAVRGEIEAWIAAGLAEWNDGLEVTPRALQRIESMPRAHVRSLPSDVVDALSDEARTMWSFLSVAGTGLPIDTIDDALGFASEPSLRELESADAVDIDDDELAWTVLPSRDLASLDADTRAAWSGAISEAVPPDSEEAFHHLVAAGQHAEACRAAIVAAKAHAAEGRNDRAHSVLTEALAVARRQLPSDGDLYDQLLDVMSGVGILRALPSSIESARYHAELAPRPNDRTRCWKEILAAAARVIRSDPLGALSRLDGIQMLPTDAHRRFFHVVANLAATRTRSIGEQRARILAAARWVRSAPQAKRRSLLSAWTGWLRFHEGKYDAAACLHARAARLASSGRARTSALCNAAVAAVEAGDLSAAKRYTERTTDSAMASRDTANLAQSERLARVIAYRSEREVTIDEELLDATSRLDRAGVWGPVVLCEAAIGWRAGQFERAAELADRARAAFAADQSGAIPALAAALAAACRDCPDSSLEAYLDRRAESLSPVGIAAQAAAMLAAVVMAQPPARLIDRAVQWAHSVAHPTLRREVLTPNEVLARLQPQRDPSKSKEQ